MSKKRTSLILGLLAGAEAQGNDFNLIQETRDRENLEYSAHQMNLSSLGTQNMVDNLNENIRKRQQELMQMRQDQDSTQPEPFTFSTKDDRPRRDNAASADGSPVTFIDASANNLDPNNLGPNALEETWGPGDHKKYKKQKKKRDKRTKYRNMEQFELDKEDEEQRRKAYEAELTRKEDARKAREDLKRKEVEQEEKDRLEQEQKLIERNERDRKDKEDEEKAHEDARKARKENMRKIRDEEQRAEEERIARHKVLQPYANSPTQHHRHRRNANESDSEDHYFNELLGLEQSNRVPSSKNGRGYDNYQQSLYANEEVDFFFNPKFKTYSSEESVYESEEAVPSLHLKEKPSLVPEMHLKKQEKRQKRNIREKELKKPKKKPEEKEPKKKPEENEHKKKPEEKLHKKKPQEKELKPAVIKNTESNESGSGSESRINSESKPSSESSFLSGYEQSSFDSNAVSSDSSLSSSSISSSSSSSNKSNTISSEISSEESSIRYSSISTERTPSIFNSAKSDQNELMYHHEQHLQVPTHYGSTTEMILRNYDQNVLDMWHEHQNMQNDLLQDEKDSQFVQWYKDEKKLIDEREERAIEAVKHAKLQAEIADARIGHAEHRAQLAQGRLAMLDRESYDAEKRLDDLKSQSKDAGSKIRDIERRQKDANRRADSHEKQMLEAEIRWAIQEQQIIDSEIQNQRQKRTAIKEEQKDVESQIRALAEESLTAQYESLFQKEEHSSKRDLVHTIRNQRAQLEKLFPLELDQVFNHPSRTEFPDLRKIPSETFDPKIIPPFKGQEDSKGKQEKKSAKELLEEQKQQFGKKEQEIKDVLKTDEQKAKEALKQDVEKADETIKKAKKETSETLQQDAKSAREALKEDGKEVKETLKQEQKKAEEKFDKAEQKLEKGREDLKKEAQIDRTAVEESLTKTKEKLDTGAEKLSEKAKEDRKELRKEFDQQQKSIGQAVDKGKEKFEERLRREEEAQKKRQQEQLEITEQKKESDQGEKKKPDVREIKPIEDDKRSSGKEEKSIWERITYPFGQHDSDSEKKPDTKKPVEEKQPIIIKPKEGTKPADKKPEVREEKRSTSQDEKSIWEKISHPFGQHESDSEKKPDAKKPVEEKKPIIIQPKKETKPADKKPEVREERPFEAEKRSTSKDEKSIWEKISHPFGQHESDSEKKPDVKKPAEVKQPVIIKPKVETKPVDKKPEVREQKPFEAQKRSTSKDEKSIWEKLSEPAVGRPLAPISTQKPSDEKDKKVQGEDEVIKKKVVEPREPQKKESKSRWEFDLGFGGDDKTKKDDKRPDQEQKGQGSKKILQNPEQDKPQLKKVQDPKKSEQDQKIVKESQESDQPWWKFGLGDDKQTESKKFETGSKTKETKTQVKSPSRRSRSRDRRSRSPGRITKTQVDVDIGIDVTTTRKQQRPTITQQQPMFDEKQQKTQQERKMKEQEQKDFRSSKEIQIPQEKPKQAEKDEEKSWWEKFSFGSDDKPASQTKQQGQPEKARAQQSPQKVQKAAETKTQPDVKIQHPIFEMPKDQRPKAQKDDRQQREKEVVQESYRERQSRRQMEQKDDDKQWWEKLGLDQDKQTQAKKTESEFRVRKEQSKSKSPRSRTEVGIDVDIEMKTTKTDQRYKTPIIQQQPMFDEQQQKTQQERRQQERVQKEKVLPIEKPQQGSMKVDDKPLQETYGSVTEQKSQKYERTEKQESRREEKQKFTESRQQPDVKIQQPMFERPREKQTKERSEQKQQREVVQESYRERQSRKQMERAGQKDQRQVEFERTAEKQFDSEAEKSYTKTTTDKKTYVLPLEPLTARDKKQTQQREEPQQKRTSQDRRQVQQPEIKREFKPAKTYEEDKQGWRPFTRDLGQESEQRGKRASEQTKDMRQYKQTEKTRSPEVRQSQPFESRKEYRGQEEKGWRPFAADEPQRQLKQQERPEAQKYQSQKDQRYSYQPSTRDSRYQTEPQEKTFTPRTRDPEPYTPQSSRKDRPITGILDDQKQYGQQKKSDDKSYQPFQQTKQPQKYEQPAEKSVPSYGTYVFPSESKKTTGQHGKSFLPLHGEQDRKLYGEKPPYWDTHYAHHSHHNYPEFEQDITPYSSVNSSEEQDIPFPKDKEVKSLKKTFDSLDKQNQRLLQEKLEKEEQGSRMVEYAEMARRKYQTPTVNLATDNRFTAEAYQNYRAQERELQTWKQQEDADLKEEFQIKLAEMRQEYHEKLADIDRSYHEKERSLEHEKTRLEHDLIEAREDLALYGDEIDEVVEFGMILPDSISSPDEYRHIRNIPVIPVTAPVQLAEKMEDDEVSPPLHRHIPGSPIHTFNEMQEVYQNLAYHQVPNKSNPPHDPLADIKRREREIQKERDYREHELRMEYEKRLEEFEADYRLKEQELEKEKLHQEKRLIAEREKEIDEDRKRVLEEAFGTDSIALGADQSDYGAEEADDEYGEQANWSEQSFEPESSENDGSVAELDFEFEFVPKKREKGKGKDTQHKWSSERDHKHEKGHRHHQLQNSSEDENDDHHHHKSKHHHSKKHSHDSKSKHRSKKSKHHKSEKHHKKHHEKESHKKHHHHHHNEVELESVENTESNSRSLKTHHLDLNIPSHREHTIYHAGISNIMTEEERQDLKNAAKNFGSQLLNLQLPEVAEQTNGAKGKKSKKSKKKSHKKEEDDEEKEQKSEQKAQWATTRAHLELSKPLTPIDTHWRDIIPHITESELLQDEDFKYHVQEHARIHEDDLYEADHEIEDYDTEMIDYGQEQESEVSIATIDDSHLGDIPVVPVHHSHPKSKHAKAKKTEEKVEEQPVEDVLDEKEEHQKKKSEKKSKSEDQDKSTQKERSRYHGTPEKTESRGQDKPDDDENEKFPRFGQYKSHKKDKKSKKERKAEEKFGRMAERQFEVEGPERYYSFYGYQKPMMPQMPHEPMFDSHQAPWFTPSSYWDPHIPQFMVQDPARYPEPHSVEHLTPRVYPSYYPQTYYTPLHSASSYPSVLPHPDHKPVHFAAEHPPVHPITEHPLLHAAKEHSVHSPSHSVIQDPLLHATQKRIKPVFSQPEDQKKTFGLELTVKDRPDSQHGESKSGEKYKFEVPTEHSPSIRLPKQDSKKPATILTRPQVKAVDTPETALTKQKMELTKKTKEELPISVGSPIKPQDQPTTQLAKPLGPTPQVSRKPVELAPQIPKGKSADYMSGYETGYEKGVKAERELLMQEFKHKYQMKPFEITQDEKSELEQSNKKNDYYDRYHGRNELFESPRPHKLIDYSEDHQAKIAPTTQETKPLEQKQKLQDREKVHQELVNNDEEESDIEGLLDAPLVPMQDQYGHQYFVPYHDPDYLMKEGYFEEHMQPIIQFVPVRYDEGAMVIEEHEQEDEEPTAEESGDDIESILEDIYEDLDYVLKKEYGESLFTEQAASAYNANALSNYFAELVGADDRLQNNRRQNSSQRDQILSYLLS